MCDSRLAQRSNEMHSPVALRSALRQFITDKLFVGKELQAFAADIPEERRSQFTIIMPLP